MKRFLFSGMTLMLTLASVACSGTAENRTSDKKVLVVSYSATGSTERVAEYIASETGGDLFRIEPVESYTSSDLNWRDPTSRVVREHEDESLRNVELVKTIPDHWDEYDTIFIGYPIWWGIAAWPLNTFIKDNDFTGKMVIPFCTSASSGLGSSAGLLEEAAGGGTWTGGHRFASSVSESDVKAWVKALD